MQRDVTNSLPRDWFAPVGAIQLSARALEIARTSISDARRREPDADWIVALDWAESRRSRRRDRPTEWIDHGAGIDMCVYRRHQVPSDVVQKIDGIDVAFKIREDVWQASRERVVDVVRDDQLKFILR